ncbi:outer membrane lipoprotein-sorting protein [Pseudodesulfovibrio cashew]|uniref:Outer membrane lipoprotein-sorting protein n=2 Tax=Pseudodesulfovibrio cashew TaxID=2678688 RepID=A0A6I6JF36_9BACT|nr:outer membrane lipoprotein-sorting protein [Pseudodesulfovibrio cashew]
MHMIKHVLLLTVICLVFGTGQASAMDAGDVLQAVDRNLAPVSYESYRKLINIEPDGSKREYVLYTIKKGQDMVASVFLEPSSEKGRATLRLGDNMWLHIPSVAKPVRITSLQSVTGGIFNNADIMRLDYSVEYAPESMEENDDAYVLHLKAKTNDVAYDKLEMLVAKDRLVPTEIKCLAASGMLIKTLHFKKMTDFGDGFVRPAIVETDSPLHKGYLSVMIFARMKARDFSDEVFTLNYLPRIETLRR